MPLSIHQVSVPVFERVLKALSNCTDKAAAHAEAHKIDPAAYINFRFFPDMFPFSRQIQQATVHGAAGPARLAGIDLPKFDEADKSFADLKARIGKALDFIAAIDPAKMEGSESRELKLMAGGRERVFKTGYDYLFTHAMPNFFFHATTAYNMLRHNGIELGKRDFLNNE
jgi:hypothetical protein